MTSGSRIAKGGVTEDDQGQQGKALAVCRGLFGGGKERVQESAGCGFDFTGGAKSHKKAGV